MIKRLYVLRDTVTNDIKDLIMVQHNDAVAIRSLGDIYHAQGSALRNHINDYELVCLGELDFESKETKNPLWIDPEYRVIMTGSQWLAAQTTSKEDGKA